MEGYIKLVESCNSQNEIKVVAELKNFVYENEKTFSFRHLEPSNRRKFIDALLTKLSAGNCGSELKTQALSALRILSRDKDVLGVLTSERSIFTVLFLAELSTEGFSTGKDDSTSSKEDEHNKNNSLDNISGKASVVIEALKCLCNVVFHSKTARQHCFKHKAIEAIIARVKRWFDNTGLVTDVKYFDLRFLFLLTALENFARDEVVAHNGFCVLTHALDSCIPGKEERKICHEAKVTDGCGQLTGSKLQALSLLERSFIEENPQSYSMTEDEIRLSAEILKTMFNISLRLSDTDDSDTIEHCERIVFIIRSMFVHIKGLADCPQNLPTHAMNMASNMPKSCLKHLYWSIPPNVSRKLAKEYESRPSSRRFKIHFENYNMLSVQHMLIVLDDCLRSTGPPPKDHLVSALSTFCQLARGNRLIRKYLRQEVLPPLGRVGTTRPEEGNLIRNRLVRLMTSPLEDIKELVSDFLFVLCKENVNRLVKYTGYGNAAGLLASRGLMGGGQGHECEYSSDEGDSETEEYAMDKSQIDPMIGAIPVDDGKPNPLDEMTEEEKEEEAEKLAKLIRDLNRKGIIKTAQVGPDGRPQKIPELSNLQDKNGPESSESIQKDEDEKPQESICSMQSTQTESEDVEPQIKRPETEGERTVEN